MLVSHISIAHTRAPLSVSPSHTPTHSLTKQAKELVEGAPKVIKKDVKKEEVRGCQDHIYTHML